MNNSANTLKRFMSRVIVTSTDKCWLWTGCTQIKGYGVFYATKTQRIGAHRASWILHKGVIPDGIQVLHKCDNPPCVNPDHLFLGTNDDNVADKVFKGRQARMGKENNPMWKNYEKSAKGEDAPCVKLNEFSVKEIRIRLSRGESQTKLAEIFGVKQATISSIFTRKTWKHI